jgi:hypothetical protein
MSRFQSSWQYLTAAAAGTSLSESAPAPSSTVATSTHIGGDQQQSHGLAATSDRQLRPRPAIGNEEELSTDDWLQRLTAEPVATVHQGKADALHGNATRKRGESSIDPELTVQSKASTEPAAGCACARCTAAQ